MKLLIDAGNTRIKWALVGDATSGSQTAAHMGDAPEAGNWLCKGDLPTGQVGELSRNIAEQFSHRYPGADFNGIKQVWVSNVAGENVARHIRSISAGISVQPHFAVACEKQCGVRNGYTSFSQLGSDRWAALIATWDMVKGKCLVVISGTATTVDTLSGQGEFVGGLILPGVALMQRSLNEATNQLRSTAGKYVPFPLNTADAIYSGAIQATCGAIERQYFLLDDDSMPVVLSGGMAAKLQPYLDQKLFKAPPRVVDDLVLRGLLMMAQEAGCGGSPGN